MKQGLEELEARLHWELETLKYPSRPWVLRPQGMSPEAEDEYEVAIIGGGQSGLAACFALQREGITKVLVLDENPPGRAGPWTSFARMPTLRTPKQVTGIDCGIPSLSVRAWYEACFGRDAWQQIKLIGRQEWVAYLGWFETVLALPVRHHTKVGAMGWDQQRLMFRLPLRRGEAGAPHERSEIFARKVVLATGIDGAGAWEVPQFVREAIPSHFYHHTNEEIDFSALRGKSIGVLGAGASAFDNAIMACSHGAARVDMFYRRKEMVKVNPYRWAEFVGFLKHHADLASDEDKWNFMRQFIGMGQLPPPDTYQTATSFAQFSLHPGSSWQQLREAEGKVEVTTAQGTFFFDQLIIGTGFVTDLGRRPELAELYPYMALWHDRFTPEQQGMEDFLRFPYLGAGSSFQEKHPGQAPFIRGLFNFNFGCILSNGLGGASLSGMKYSLRRLCDEITRQFYIEAKDEHLESLTRFDRADFLGKEDER